MGAALVVLAGALVWAVLETRWAKERREAKALAAKKEADEAKQAAEKQAKFATSRQLAALSASERNKQLDLSLLLAVEALRPRNTFEARDSLFKPFRTDLVLTSFLHVKEGDVTSVAFSPDGKTIAAGYGAAAGAAGWCCGTWPARSGWRRTARREGGRRYERGLQPRRQDPRRGIRGVGGGGGVVLWDAAGAASGWPTTARREGGRRHERGLQPRRQDPRRRIRRRRRRRRGGAVGRGRRKRLAEDPLAVKEGDVKSVAFSPDGKTLAAGYGGAAAAAGWCCGTWPAEAAGGGPARREGGRRQERGVQPRRQDPRRGIRRRRGVGGGVVLWDVAGASGWRRIRSP